MEETIKSPIKAIRAKCMECSNYQVVEIKTCNIETCALHPFRFGRNPFRKPMTEEQKQKSRERMQKMREEGRI